jgi:hypothetical protein
MDGERELVEHNSNHIYTLTHEHREDRTGLGEGADHRGELHFIPPEVEDQILCLFVGALAMEEFRYKRGRRESGF